MSFELDIDDLECEAEAYDAERRQRLDNPHFRAALDDAESRVRLIRDLTQIRVANGLTQAQVAATMGTTQSAISDLEGADVDPHFSTLQRYARSVGSQLHVRCSVRGAQAPQPSRNAALFALPPMADIRVHAVFVKHRSGASPVAWPVAPHLVANGG